mmetsp:Transcript_4713/g.8051  ORF Transcript_4713/g.8051 Transcript_4713/m.8051 type:complete len:202 (-) Transcript_4713:831-1436(-)
MADDVTRTAPSPSSETTAARLWRVKHCRNGTCLNRHKIGMIRGGGSLETAFGSQPVNELFTRGNMPSLKSRVKLGMALATLYIANPNRDKPYPQICMGVTTFPKMSAPNQTVAAFFAVPTTLRVRADVVLITAHVVTLTKNPSAAASKYNSGSSSIFANRFCSTKILDSKTTIPKKSQATVVGAMAYRPSSGLNVICWVII